MIVSGVECSATYGTKHLTVLLHQGQQCARLGTSGMSFRESMIEA